MDKRYRDQVQLLLDVLPYVAEEPAFALKGGTAINLFEWDLPRLSVDIDLTYLPLEDRGTSLRSITDGLLRIKKRIEDKLKPTKATLVDQGGGLEAKLNCQRGTTQIKIEVNPILRGHLLPIRTMACSARVQEMFELFVETPVVSRGELFGGKICAALDRQHPRDLFDVKRLLDEGSLTDEVRYGMLTGLASHGRPIAELIKPTLKDRKEAFASQFEGMPFEPFTYDDHVETLERLSAAIANGLTDNERAFLTSFEGGDPEWALFPLPGLEALPAPQWKLQNLRKLRDAEPDRHAQGVEALKRALAATAASDDSENG
jgi:hypothetical protein